MRLEMHPLQKPVALSDLPGAWDLSDYKCVLDECMKGMRLGLHASYTPTQRACGDCAQLLVLRLSIAAAIRQRQ
jgi:hypothetical protein